MPGFGEPGALPAGSRPTSETFIFNLHRLWAQRTRKEDGRRETGRISLKGHAHGGASASGGAATDHGGEAASVSWQGGREGTDSYGAVAWRSRRAAGMELPPRAGTADVEGPGLGAGLGKDAFLPKAAVHERASKSPWPPHPEHLTWRPGRSSGCPWSAA